MPRAEGNSESYINAVAIYLCGVLLVTDKDGVLCKMKWPRTPWRILEVLKRQTLDGQGIEFFKCIDEDTYEFVVLSSGGDRTIKRIMFVTDEVLASIQDNTWPLVDIQDDQTYIPMISGFATSPQGAPKQILEEFRICYKSEQVVRPRALKMIPCKVDKVYISRSFECYANGLREELTFDVDYEVLMKTGVIVFYGLVMDELSRVNLKVDDYYSIFVLYEAIKHRPENITRVDGKSSYVVGDDGEV
jgi:hypothetical protein